MTDTVVTLGDFAFQGFEVPERIGFGGDQRLAVHKFVGGARVVDSMGPDDRPLTWGGRFRGPDALARCDTLDAMRIAGLPVALLWGEKAYTVVISSFLPDYDAFYEIPYAITCEIVSNDARPMAGGAGIGLDEMMSGDLDFADGLADGIGDATLSGQMSTLDSVFAGIKTFTNAPQALINSVLNPIMDAQGRVTDLFTAAQSVVAAGQGVGGVVSGLAPLTAATAFLGQLDAMTDSADLLGMGSRLGRMAKNVTAIGGGGQEIVTAGGSLYQMALDSYGDASEWTTIARANGLVDPQLTGIQTILVPPLARGDGGVLTT